MSDSDRILIVGGGPVGSLTGLRRMAADPVAHRDFVLRGSLIAMLRKSEQIG